MSIDLWKREERLRNVMHRNKRHIAVKRLMSWVFLFLGIIGGIYSGGWLMFVKPIINACEHYDAGTLTGLIIGTTVVKCLFSGAVGSAVAYFGAIMGAAIESL